MSQEPQDDEQPPTKKPRLGFTKYIKVLVGPEKKSFPIHKNIICARSPLFAAACSARWSTPGKRSIELPEDSPDIFDIYLHCIYTGVVDVGNVNDTILSEDPDSDDEANWRLASVYILSDKLGDTVASNTIMAEIQRWNQVRYTLPDVTVTALVGANTTDDSPLLRLFRDFHVYKANPKAISNRLMDDRIPKAFVLAVLKERTQIEHDNRSSSINAIFYSIDPTSQTRRYHQHTEEHPCCGKGCKEKEASAKKKANASNKTLVEVSSDSD